MADILLKRSVAPTLRAPSSYGQRPLGGFLYSSRIPFPSEDVVGTELLDKREVRIRRMFGQIAPWYDFLNHLLSLNIDRAWRRKTTRLVPPTADAGPILDLCTGTGDLALTYAARSSVAIIGADFCHEML